MHAVIAVVVSFAAALLMAAGPAEAATFPAGFKSVALATGLTRPTAVAWTPNGRLLIAEQDGRLLESDGTGPPQLLLDISDHVNSYLDRGLLGLAVDPDFAANHYLYLLYTLEDDAANPQGPKVSRLT